MRITLNGQVHLTDARVLADLVVSTGSSASRPGVALAVNGAVVHREEWMTRPVRDGDAVEIVTAVQGG